MAANPPPPGGGKVRGARWLGDEWVDWAGETGSAGAKAGKGTFLACATLGFVFLLLGAWLLLYLVEPRLFQLPATLYFASKVSFWILFALAGAWFVSVALSAVLERRVGLALLRYNKGISLLYTVASFAARRAGLRPMDRTASRNRAAHAVRPSEPPRGPPPHRR